MDISAALAADLALLTHALDKPGIDLEIVVQAFVADVKRAIDSYTGMTMTIGLGGHTVTFTVRDDTTTEPATSLLIPLAALTGTDAASTLLLYAATPGAFVDLAADLSYALGIDLAVLVLDAHLDAPTESAGIRGLEDHSVINRAIGILIGRGHTHDSARQELHRLAAHDHGSLRAAAESLIGSTSGGSLGAPETV